MAVEAPAPARGETVAAAEAALVEEEGTQVEAGRGEVEVEVEVRGMELRPEEGELEVRRGRVEEGGRQASRKPRREAAEGKGVEDPRPSLAEDPALEQDPGGEGEGEARAGVRTACWRPALTPVPGPPYRCSGPVWRAAPSGALN